MTRRAPGALEAEVMGVLWAAQDPLSPEQVRQQLPGDLAYTTVMTILVRLVEKGAVVRRPAGRGYVYEPCLDQAGLTAQRMRSLLESEHDPAGVLSRFVEGLDARSEAALRRALGRRPRP
ncbi:MAG TPA: BlaI/MecI/CopY family transcriptional regulator [Acidimicrobiales bacterium]|nr:BlaI/MecI/CopY family transcriptional regulator [Acidimicrobiales bacterium]